MSSCAMVGSAVASATTGSEVNFGLTKAKNMMFYTQKFPPHDKEAWKQYSNLTCDELRILLGEKNESMKIRSLKYNLMLKMKILLILDCK